VALIKRRMHTLDKLSFFPPYYDGDITLFHCKGENIKAPSQVRCWVLNITGEGAQFNRILCSVTIGVTALFNRNIHVIDQLKTNQYIHNRKNVILLGATGSNKSFLANELGIHACESGYTIKYGRMIEILSDLEINKLQGTYWQFIKQLAKIDLLIIDDFLLSSTTQQEQQDLMEVMEKRSRNRSTIFCSQMEIEE
jgi:hypothetical protein